MTFDCGHFMLKPIEVEHAQEFYNYRTDPRVNVYHGWIPDSIEETVLFLKEKVADKPNKTGTWFQWGIWDGENTLLGDIGTHFLNPDGQQVELGICIGKPYQRMGFASAALKTIIDYLYNDLGKHRLIANIDPRNIPSLALFNLLGFQKEAHFRKDMFLRGEWLDSVIMARLKEDG